MTVAIKGRGHDVAGVMAFFLTISTIAIFLRCYCRVKVVKNFGLDDWSALVAWVIFVIFITFGLLGVHHGTGQHFADLPTKEFPVALKWWWCCEPTYILTNMAIKFSIAVMLLRLCVSRFQRAIIYVNIVMMEVYSAFFCLLFILQCRPSAYFWTKYTGGKGTCINAQVTVGAFYGYAAISCWTDWTFALIPIFLVWNLQMNIRTKLSVGAILACGVIASMATIIRFPYLKGMTDLSDFLYATVGVAVWSTCETGLAITAASVATLRPLFREFYSRSNLFGGSTSARKHGTNPWPKSGISGPGYIRSPGNDEISLRTDINKSIGMTITIDARGDLERGHGGKGGRQNIDGIGKQKNQRGWNSSESRLNDDTSSEEVTEWNEEAKGIRRTVVTTTDHH